MRERYLKQLVQCSEREESFFLRTVMIGAENAIICHIQALPPGYEYAMAMKARGGNEVFTFAGSPEVPEDMRCPFCNNYATCKCHCGVMSCMNEDKRFHMCPACGNVAEPVLEERFFASTTGLLKRTALPEPARVIPVAPVERPRRPETVRRAIPASTGDGWMGKIKTLLLGPADEDE